MWKWTVLLISFCLANIASAAEESKALDAYFPLAPGTTWKYLVTVKGDKSEPQMTAQTVTVETQRHNGKAVIVASDNVYATQDDGVYIVGVVRNAKLEPLEEPQKVVPASPKQGDTWTYREAAGVTSATVLGMEKVKTAAGEYDAAKIYLVTVGGTDQNDRKEVYRWFARGVGPVKGSVTQHRPNADGSIATIEISMELTSYTPAGKGKDPKAAVAAAAGNTAGANVEMLFAQAQAAARKGDHRTALAQYDAAIAADPKFAKLHAYKTLSLIATRQFDAAETEIDRALSLDDKDYTFVEIAGQLKIAQGKIAEGNPLYEKAAGMSPQNAGAIYTDLAAALAARNDDKLAPEIDKALKNAAAAKPPSPQALFALGQSYASAGRPEGRQYLQRYVEVASALPAEKRDDRQIRLAKQLIRALDVVKGAP
jgi:thioredoxin-like negative regulator of GroEL